jgi:lysophospholipase L1-like esterase
VAKIKKPIVFRGNLVFYVGIIIKEQPMSLSRKITLVICAAIIALQPFSFIPLPSASAVASFSWTSDQNPTYIRQENQAASPFNSESCTRKDMLIGQLPQARSICAYETPFGSYGRYSSSTGENNLFINFQNDSRMYKITNLPFDPLPLPVPMSNDFVYRYAYPNRAYRNTLHIYKDIHRSVKKTYSSVGELQYEYTKSTPDFTLKDSDGAPTAAHAVNVSENGKWLVVEVPELGLFRINTETFEVIKFSGFTLPYGYGRNPAMEFAVSNDGKHVVVAGQNVPLRAFSLDNCGDSITTGIDKYSTGTNNPCPDKDLSELITQKIGQGAWQTFNPNFNIDAGELRLYIQAPYSPQGGWVTLTAAGYTAQHLDYLAMGDSFSSGEGENDDAHYIPGTNVASEPPEKCHVSDRSYPYLLSTILAIPKDKFKNIACSGAVITDLNGDLHGYFGQDKRLSNTTNSASYQQSALENFTPGRVPQIEFVKKYQPKIITVSVGGNDIGFGQKISECVASPSTCSHAADLNQRRKDAEEARQHYSKLLNLYQDIKKASPYSKIYVLSYPVFTDPQGSCEFNVLLDSDERTYVNEGTRYLNSIIKNAALRSGVQYIDITNSLGNQVLCGSESPKAVNGLTLGDDSAITPIAWKLIARESYHPNPIGHDLMKSNIVSTIPNLLTHSICETAPTGCPDTSAKTPDIPAYFAHGDVDSPQPSQKTWNLVSTLPRFYTKKVAVPLEASWLSPHSTATVEIHSNPISLGEYAVNEKGELKTTVTLPESLPNGYHTLHVFGKSSSDEPLDLYQTILVADKEDPAPPSSEVPPQTPSSPPNIEQPPLNTPVPPPVVKPKATPYQRLHSWLKKVMVWRVKSQKSHMLTCSVSKTQLNMLTIAPHTAHIKNFKSLKTKDRFWIAIAVGLKELKGRDKGLVNIFKSCLRNVSFWRQVPLLLKQLQRLIKGV